METKEILFTIPFFASSLENKTMTASLQGILDAIWSIFSIKGGKVLIGIFSIISIGTVVIGSLVS